MRTVMKTSTVEVEGLVWTFVRPVPNLRAERQLVSCLGPGGFFMPQWSVSEAEVALF